MRLTAVILAPAAVVLAMPEASPDPAPAPQFKQEERFGKGKGQALRWAAWAGLAQQGKIRRHGRV